MSAIVPYEKYEKHHEKDFKKVKEVKEYKDYKEIKKDDELVEKNEKETKAIVVKKDSDIKKDAENKLKLLTTKLTNKSSTKYKPNQIVDFITYYKHLTLTDNEFLYYKRVGNPVEYVECHYEDIQISKNNPLVKKNSKSNKATNDYLTISKNVNK